MANERLEFSSINELYKHLLPALDTKVAEIKRQKIYHINASLIFEYCFQNKWAHKTDLRLHEMVGDILNVDTIKLIEYLKKEGANNARSTNNI